MWHWTVKFNMDLRFLIFDRIRVLIFFCFLFLFSSFFSFFFFFFLILSRSASKFVFFYFVTFVIIFFFLLSKCFIFIPPPQYFNFPRFTTPTPTTRRYSSFFVLVLVFLCFIFFSSCPYVFVCYDFIILRGIYIEISYNGIAFKIYVNIST